MQETLEISVRGRPQTVPARRIAGAAVIERGRLLKSAQLFDQFWLEVERIPDLDLLVDELRRSAHRPDLLFYTQRVPDTEPRYRYSFRRQNFAVLQLTTYDAWFQSAVSAATRRNVRASEKRGVSVRVCQFDDAYVAGISAIYNESPVRAGRPYWHYGKPLDVVRKENGTYAARSTYLAAFIGEEMVGYMKIVWDRKTAAIMQILSKTSAREARPNNALMAEAVRQACARGVEWLIYEKFDYGNKVGDSLTRFKQGNGFVRMDVPRYCVALTVKGKMALAMGMDRELKDMIPERLAARAREWRARWLESRVAMA
jgi:hypothetical protein